MPQYNIPKLARNKYNFVKGADGNNYMTASRALVVNERSGGINRSDSSLVQSQINNTLYYRGYVDDTELDDRLSYYSSNDVDVEDEQTKTVSQDDGIIVLTYSSASNSVTLPTTDIKDGKVIYIINKTGRDYTLYTAGEIVEKSAASRVQSQTISDNIIQCIYYDSEWFVV